jgi:type IX secretion system PorP/SprF family membrane protein
MGIFYKWMMRLSVAIALLLMASRGWAQQKTVLSQYMFNGLALNPAYAGNQNQLNVTGLYRKQWLNMDGAPNTQTFSAHAGFKNKKVGLGLLVSRDEIGVHRDMAVYASYAYKIRLSSGTLAMGLQGGFSQLSSDFSQLSVKFADPSLSGGMVNMSPNFGTGLFYSNKTTYVGLSVPYLLNNRLYRTNDAGQLSKSAEARYYFLTAGKVLEVNKQVKVVPSLLLRMHEGAPLGVDVNMMVTLNEVVHLGASYRSSDAAVFFFQLQVDPHFRFGYAYDFTLSALSPYTQGSHEFMLNYSIKLTKDRCHTYF